jgi:hypothetical protein
MKVFSAKGREAAALRKRKYRLVRRCGFDGSLLPGSLTLTHRRCGKPTCHCNEDEGHPMWVLSFSIDGVKHVEVVPRDVARALEPLVGRGREHREALAELMRLNAELVGLWLVERRVKKARSADRRKTARRRSTR